MADRLRGHERRFSDVGACSHPSAESLIGRLDELDIRLRQLEEKQSVPESYFSADLRRTATRLGQHQHQCKPLASALQNVCLNGTLMDRLHLLETQIQQLSSELDKGGNNSGSSNSMQQVNENESIQTVRLEKNKGNSSVLSSNRVAVEMYQKPKKKDSKEVTDAMERRTSVMRCKEKRRMERTQLYKKWFSVGC